MCHYILNLRLGNFDGSLQWILNRMNHRVVIDPLLIASFIVYDNFHQIWNTLQLKNLRDNILSANTWCYKQNLYPGFDLIHKCFFIINGTEPLVSEQLLHDCTLVLVILLELIRIVLIKFYPRDHTFAFLCQTRQPWRTRSLSTWGDFEMGSRLK